jgi:hypothetical protein
MAGLSLRAPFPVALDEQELRLIRSLREIPPSPLRDRMTELIREVVAFVASPACSEAQADGAPCCDVHAACDCCGRMLGLLERLRGRLLER